MADVKLAERAGTSVNDRLRRSAEWRLRQATSQWRRLPDFIIIGGQRCGTTSLFYSLAEHPKLIPSFRKEVHYFDFHHRTKDLGWYRANFPMRTRSPDRHPTFEATPNYLAYPGAPEALHAVLPSVKLIALLRDPIERAHSSWRFTSFQGNESRSFAEAVEAEAHDGPSVDRRMGTPDAKDMRDAYLEKSRYAQHLMAWLEVFPRAQLLILESEELFAHPQQTIGRLLEFVNPDLDRDVPLLHIHASPPADIEPGLRSWLSDYFQPHNRRLAEIAGREFSWS